MLAALPHAVGIGRKLQLARYSDCTRSERSSCCHHKKVTMCITATLSRAFDVRRHLGTKTRYAYRLAMPGAPPIYKLPDPDGYTPAHLYLLARHGTRWPTADRMKQINSLEQLFRDARNTADHPWLSNWTAPFADSIGFMGGELHPVGAEELWGLAYRLRQRFPQLAGQEYLPKRFPVVSTQVARTAASASAFTGGFFPDVTSPDPEDDAPDVNPAPAVPPGPDADGDGGGDGAGGLGARRETRSLSASPLDPLDPLHPHAPLDPSLTALPGRAVRRPQAVAVSMAPKDADPLLRFFDCCPAYAQHDEYTEQWISGWMQGNWSRLVPALESRLGLSRSMSPCEVEALWQLCLMEAGLYGEAGRACRLFTPEEVLMLEWVDDVHLLETQAWGATINYEIAAPLLRDAVASLTAAAGRGRGSAAGGAAARLLFAHCETLVPLATLMGLFRPPQPQPPDASPEHVAQHVAAAAAQRHLRAVDAVEDLHLRVQRMQQRGGPLRSEDSHACYQGRPFPGPADTIPPPPGWTPPLPNDESRAFTGSRIAPFGANMALVLYARTARGAAAAAGGRPTHLVRLLYNEQVLPLPGCGALGQGRGQHGQHGLDCDLDTFLQLVEGKADADALERLCGREGQVVGGDGGANAMFHPATPGSGSSRRGSRAGHGGGAGAGAAGQGR